MNEIDHDKYLKDVRRRIRKVYREKSHRGSSKISPGEELQVIVNRHQKTLKNVPHDLRLWLSFFDEAIAFWFAVWATYKDQIEGQADKRMICLMALSGRALQDAICVRKMILGGFFVQSNVVARSLIEAIDVMHLLNSRPELSSDFQAANTNDESSSFWHKHCSKNKIHRIAKERWLWFFDGDEELAKSFHGVREDYLDLVGMSAHPSFGASFSTFMDSVESASNIANNAMGAISHMSKFTMHLIVLRMFEYGLLWSGPELSLYKGDGELIKKPLLYDNIKKGLSVLLSIVKATGEQRAGDPFYPEFKTYWPSQNFEK